MGGEQTLPKSARAAAAGGHIYLLGLLSGSFGKPDPALAGSKPVHFDQIYVGSRAMFEDMNRALTQHKVKPVIDRTFPFEQAREALRYLQDGAHFGKVVIKV